MYPLVASCAAFIKCMAVDWVLCLKKLPFVRVSGFWLGVGQGGARRALVWLVVAECDITGIGME